MTIKKIVRQIHLWLGLASGIVILFLGITGCILAFELEIRSVTEPYQFVIAEKRVYLPPSTLKAEAEKYLKGKKVVAIEYRGNTRSTIASYYDLENYSIVFLNPYSGKMLKVKDMNHDFFRTVLMGHYYLWLPPNIGQPILASATLIFLLMMISGLILWWPRSKAAAKQRFSIKWSARWRRKNYDLHYVLGFYMTWVSIFIAVTGLVMGFEWFAKTVYWSSSGGEKMPEHIHPVSDTTKRNMAVKDAADKVWLGLLDKAEDKEGIGLYYPVSAKDPLEGTVNHRPGTFYNMDYYHYDQYTTEELPATGIYSGKFKDAAIANKISRMNYDIHLGAVLGIPGKILTFFASLIAASLPVTGFYIWWGRKTNKTVRR